MNIGKCGFFMRKDYGQIILFGMISIIILWIMKYVLPYFLPFAVALITVVPLHASFIRKGLPLQSHFYNMDIFWS